MQLQCTSMCSKTVIITLGSFLLLVSGNLNGLSKSNWHRHNDSLSLSQFLSLSPHVCQIECPPSHPSPTVSCCASNMFSEYDVNPHTGCSDERKNLHSCCYPFYKQS